MPGHPEGVETSLEQESNKYLHRVSLAYEDRETLGPIS